MIPFFKPSAFVLNPIYLYCRAPAQDLYYTELRSIVADWKAGGAGEAGEAGGEKVSSLNATSYYTQSGLISRFWA